MSRVLIFGFGISGQGVARTLMQKKISYYCLDQKACEFKAHPLYQSGCFFTEPSQVPWSECSCVIFSPGFSPDHPWLEYARDEKIPLLSDIEFALKYLLEEGKQLLAITGSNGKTTTTLLAAHLLGKKAAACGNVGVSLCDFIGSEKEILVIELSSFQLEVLGKGPYFHAAALLNLTPNHLDRHKTFRAYTQAKCRLSYLLKMGAPLWVQQSLELTLKPFLANNVFVKNIESFYERLESIFPLGYEESVDWMATHDHSNALFAYALVEPYGISCDIFLERLKNFCKPPHRLEFVKEVMGVRYINDSKATSVAAVMTALRAQKSPVLLISGGVDKGGSFKELARMREKLKKVYAYGQAAQRIKKELNGSVEVEEYPSLDESLEMASSAASPGDVVLLSCGCSSFDQFKNYEERGSHFKRLVDALGEEKR